MKNVFRLTLLVFCFMIYSAELKSQNYIPMLSDSLYWDIAYYDMNVLICTEYGNQGTGPFRYAIDTDTSINGVVYKKLRSYLFHTLLTQPSPNCPPFEIDTFTSISPYVTDYIFMREDTATRQVFVYDSNTLQEHLWYDFNVQIGDTIHYPIHGEFVVDTIFNIVTLDNVSRMYVKGDSSSNMYCGYYIEGLGGPGGLMHEPFYIFELEPWLMCVKDLNQNIIYNNNSSQCFNFSTGINEAIAPPISIYPNPATEIIKLKQLNTGQTIVLFNTMGEKTAVFNNVNNQIPVSDLPQGVYFVCLIMDNVSYPVGSFVKQ